MFFFKKKIKANRLSRDFGLDEISKIGTWLVPKNHEFPIPNLSKFIQIQNYSIFPTKLLSLTFKILNGCNHY